MELFLCSLSRPQTIQDEDTRHCLHLALKLPRTVLKHLSGGQ